uniref:Uncharacterized protein n=1 Tax=Anguilla anguilla TaxID=7936 RepID=A0A0E9QFK8_ANGAN
MVMQVTGPEAVCVKEKKCRMSVMNCIAVYTC